MTTIVNLGVKIPTFVSKKELKEAVKDLTQQEGKTLKDLSLVFTDDDYLLEVNKQYLNHDYFTDVITFDYSSFPEVSGDVMISLDRVKDNAATLNQSFELEFYRVVFHGVLHLCGYKDKTDADAAVMRSKEDFYINRFVSRETNQN
ncbi:MAG: rRNA maturation RNase YbeY [Crocinitomicaceae bacterium]|jgi:probable rRNA maturation factor|nr:rRNA maturation RNase YbeY [Crocinitomicaceae bacterium]MDP4723777.1 rRNA maturation RNase YbeY [Crocinitomicaceae bacterium]MDP4739417.1 rRNA maturation RNase YbeY [Crocinitomicaceae bacterium]MDP4805936.1 rRNA maturation RNase YbeY [Crocinitomicaceae bacterium]MDP4867891.1 rRNA maturation RNase YbeY [Crocinitomicaceae bacterium]